MDALISSSLKSQKWNETLRFESLAIQWFCLDSIYENSQSSLNFWYTWLIFWSKSDLYVIMKSYITTFEIFLKYSVFVLYSSAVEILVEYFWVNSEKTDLHFLSKIIKYFNNQISLIGRFVFKKKEIIYSITSYRYHFCTFLGRMLPQYMPLCMCFVSFCPKKLRNVAICCMI